MKCRLNRVLIRERNCRCGSGIFQEGFSGLSIVQGRLKVGFVPGSERNSLWPYYAKKAVIVQLVCVIVQDTGCGILARISKVLAANEKGIFAIFTYNTEYVLTKEENFRKALDALRGAGYEIEE